MPSVNNTLIGAIRVEASLDGGKFVDGARKIRVESKQTERQVKESFSGMGAAVKAGIAGFVGALTVGTFTTLIKAGLDYAKSIGEISQQLGVSTKDLQGFRFAASQVGVSQQQLDTGLSHLTETLGKVAAGAERPTKALNAIGITAKQLSGLDTGAALRIIADGLSKVQDRSERAAIELALFGESGSRLDGLLSGGSDRINELSEAASRLGIVLSDRQIQEADRTAQKLEDLKTVLSAQIAGIVADNAQAIYQFADSLAHLVGQIPDAIRGLKSLYASFLDVQATARDKLNPFLTAPIGGLPNPFALFSGRRAALSQSERAQAEAIRKELARSALSAIPLLPPELSGGRRSTSSIPQFLAPKPRSHRTRSHRAPRDRSDDVTAQFEREQLQADREILQAKQQLAGTSEQRAAIALQLIQLDHDMQAAEIDDRVRRAQRDKAEGKITDSALKQVEAQAEVLRARNDEATQIKMRAFVEEQMARAEEAQFQAADQQRGFAIESLRLADQMATTQADHRRIQLQILDAEIAQRRLELEHEKQLAIRNGATAEEIKIIQDKIDHLATERAEGAAAIARGTQNPLEAWAQQVPKTADEIIESLQRIEVDGLDNLSDALTDVLMGTKSLKEAFHDVAASILADLIKMTIKMLLFKAISSAGGFSAGGEVGSVGTFASGGFVSGPGSSTSDSIPAMLSDGEYVVSAKAVQKWLPLLDAINSGRVPHLKGGGILGALRFANPVAFLQSQGLLRFANPAAFGVNWLATKGFASGGLVSGISIPRAAAMGRPVAGAAGAAVMSPVSITLNNDFSGADPAAIAAIQARLDRMQSELPGVVITTMKDARDRFLWRG